MADSLSVPGQINTHMGVGRDALPANASALIPSGDYKSTDPTAVLIPTLGATGLMIILNVTAQSGAANTITINVDVFDPVSNTFVPLATTFTYAAGAAGTKVFALDPRITPVANQIVQLPVPDQVRIRPVGSGTRTTLNYSVGAALCL